MAHGLRWRTTSADRQRFPPSPSWKDQPMARGSGPGAVVGRDAEYSQLFRGRCRPLAGCSRCLRTRCAASSGGHSSGGSFLEQCWFIARVALAPTLLVAVPFTVLISFTLNILLRELGAADLSGAGAAFGAVTQGRTHRDGADRRRGRLDRDLRRPRVAHDPRGDRRDGGAWHRSGATPGDAADVGIGFGGAAAEQPRGHHRNPRRLYVFGVHSRM